jgi:hypothetical protein
VYNHYYHITGRTPKGAIWFSHPDNQIITHLNTFLLDKGSTQNGCGDTLTVRRWKNADKVLVDIKNAGGTKATIEDFLVLFGKRLCRTFEIDLITGEVKGVE